MKIKQFIKSEVSGWKTWEVIWLVAGCGIITALSLYWHDTAMGIISAVTGVASVIFTGKGKLSAYLFGTVNVVLYAIISYKAKYYGEVMLNALYYLPMQFYGFYVWNKHMDDDTHEVKKRRMDRKNQALWACCVLVGTAAYGIILRLMGDAMPFVDAFTTVASVAAMIISVKMYAEQWLLWIIVDVATVIMWAMAFAKGNDSIATLLMWIIYLGNAVIMYVKWMREAEVNAV